MFWHMYIRPCDLHISTFIYVKRLTNVREIWIELCVILHIYMQLYYGGTAEFCRCRVYDRHWCGSSTSLHPFLGCSLKIIIVPSWLHIWLMQVFLLWFPPTLPVRYSMYAFCSLACLPAFPFDCRLLGSAVDVSVVVLVSGLLFLSLCLLYSIFRRFACRIGACCLYACLWECHTRGCFYGVWCYDCCIESVVVVLAGLFCCIVICRPCSFPPLHCCK